MSFVVFNVLLAYYFFFLLWQLSSTLSEKVFYSLFYIYVITHPVLIYRNHISEILPGDPNHVLISTEVER